MKKFNQEPETGTEEPRKKLPGKTGTLVNCCLLGAGLLLAGGLMAAGFGPIAAGLALLAPIGGKAILGHEKVFNFSTEKELTPQEKALIGTPGHERDGTLRKMANAVSTPIDVICSLVSGLGKFIPFSGIEFSSAIADGAIITPLKAGADAFEGHKKKAEQTIRDGMAKTAYEAATAPIPVPFLSVADWTEGVRGKDKAVKISEKATGLLGKRWRGFKRSLGFDAPEPAAIEPTPEQHGQIHDAAANASDEHRRKQRGRGNRAVTAQNAEAPRPTRVSPRKKIVNTARITNEGKRKCRRIAMPKEELSAHKEESAMSV